MDSGPQLTIYTSERLLDVRIEQIKRSTHRQGNQGVSNQVHPVVRTSDKAAADSLSGKGLLELELQRTIRPKDALHLLSFVNTGAGNGYDTFVGRLLEGRTEAARARGELCRSRFASSEGEDGGQIARHHDNDRSELGLATKRTLEAGQCDSGSGIVIDRLSYIDFGQFTCR